MLAMTKLAFATCTGGYSDGETCCFDNAVLQAGRVELLLQGPVAVWPAFKGYKGHVAQSWYSVHHHRKQARATT
jgi:hypothetical protein